MFSFDVELRTDRSSEPIIAGLMYMGFHLNRNSTLHYYKSSDSNTRTDIFCEAVITSVWR